MSELKPLIEAGAFWVSTDATLRIFWTIFGASFLLAGFVIAICVAVWFVRLPKKPRQP